MPPLPLHNPSFPKLFSCFSGQPFFWYKNIAFRFLPPSAPGSIFDKLFWKEFSPPFLLFFLVHQTRGFFTPITCFVCFFFGFYPTPKPTPFGKNLLRSSAFPCFFIESSPTMTFLPENSLFSFFFGPCPFGLSVRPPIPFGTIPIFRECSFYLPVFFFSSGGFPLLINSRGHFFLFFPKQTPLSPYFFGHPQCSWKAAWFWISFPVFLFLPPQTCFFDCGGHVPFQ